MRATFLTTGTNDLEKITGAWDCFNDIPSQRVTFDHNAPAIDGSILINRVLATEPDVVFYIGSCHGRGNPSDRTLKELRLSGDFDLIHICCDAGDPPWHPVLERYAQNKCFDRQVSIDGVMAAPVDFVTLTPIDLRPYEVPVKKEHLCGFAGNIGSPYRSQLVRKLMRSNDLKFLKRTPTASYKEYVHFVQSCRVILNIPITGSTTMMHVKGRVLEAIFAKCALIEMKGSPAFNWFPQSRNNIWEFDDDNLDGILNGLTESEIESRWEPLYNEAIEKYHPRNIFRGIMG